MSDDYHRPTLTFPSSAYNATQVRLYGIAGDLAFSLPDHPAVVAGTGTFVATEPGITNSAKDTKVALDLLKKHNSNAGRRNILANNIPPFPSIMIKVVYSFKIDVKQ